MVDERIKFDDEYIDEEYDTITLYFIAPADILSDKYPEAEHAEISIEFPKGYIEATYADVMISPSKDGSDYDWSMYDIPYDEIEELIKLAYASEDNTH